MKRKRAEGDQATSMPARELRRDGQPSNINQHLILASTHLQETLLAPHNKMIAPQTQNPKTRIDILSFCCKWTRLLTTEMEKDVRIGPFFPHKYIFRMPLMLSVILSKFISLFFQVVQVCLLGALCMFSLGLTRCQFRFIIMKQFLQCSLGNIAIYHLHLFVGNW